jgi:hypothetical protein
MIRAKAGSSLKQKVKLLSKNVFGIDSGVLVRIIDIRRVLECIG